MLVGLPALRDWVYHHETLSGGLLALASAILGAWFLHRQSAQADRHEQQRWQRRREAARTVLPLALSNISDYSVAAAKATKDLLDQCVGEGLPPRDQLRIPTAPSLPADSVSTIKELVETLDSQDVRPFAVVLADIQVQSSRLQTSIARAGGLERIEVKVNFEEYILDCAMIYARVGNLFPYGRGVDANVPVGITWHDVTSALFFFDIFGERYEAIYETIRRRSGGDEWRLVEDRWIARN